MKKLWNLLTNHIQEDFHLPLYLSVAVFLGCNLVVNYAIDLENSIIDKPADSPLRMLWYLLLYSWAYYSVFLLTCYFKKKKELITNKKFWLFSFCGIVILSISMGFPFLYKITRLFVSDYRIANWAYLTLSNLSGFVLIALPLFSVALYLEKENKELLGTLNKTDLRPYLIILAIIIPVIGMAAFETGLGSYYPTYRTNSVAEIMNWPAALPMVVYEVAYAIDFFNVEFLFRGFFIIGMSRIIGKEAVLPMVAMYCFLHFGKPVGEAISSIYGGHVLGVIALYTRSIWGGVILHIGVAWTMELAAYLFAAD